MHRWIWLVVLFLAACGNSGTPTLSTGPGSSALSAPSNVSVEPGDGSAVVSWDGVLAASVGGYNIYANDKKVNNEIIAASAGVASLSGTPRFSYSVHGLNNGSEYKFFVTTVETSGKESKPSITPTSKPLAGVAEIMVNPLTPQSASPNQLPPGQRREIPFEVQKPGKIEITTNFAGTNLALILNGPGEVNAYERVDGAGPLSLSHDVTAAELAKGTQWRASLVNFGNTAASDVQMNINRPLVTGPGDNIAASTIVNPLTPVGATPNSLGADGTRELFFEVQRAGRISIKAEFSGTNLALILNGPRQLGYYARVDGAGPLLLNYDVTAADLAKGTQWRLRLKNFSSTAAQNVQITLNYPNVASLSPGNTLGQILTNALPKGGDPPNALSAGDQKEVQFEVHRPGTIKVKASFSGTPLALILNGPGQLGYYQRVDGSGPLELSYDVTPTDVQKGTSWRVSLINFSATKADDTLLDIQYPTLTYSGSSATYLVRGTDMGRQAQNIQISKGGSNFDTATLKVNGTAIPSTGSGLYQGNLPATLAVGAAVNLEATTPDGTISASDVVPESPVVTAPATGAVVAANTPLNVTWTSASNPDRFRVSATWSCGPSCGTGSSFDATGTARSLTIPGGTLPANATVKVRVYALNDGTETFSGPFEAGSRLSIRNGDEVGHDINTLPSGATPGTSWGDPHLITFDSLAVEFQSTGEFDLALSNSADFRVQARQRPWGGSTVVSVNTAIATLMNGQKIGVYAGLTPPLRKGDTGTPTTVPAGGLDLGAGFTVQQSGNTYSFVYPGGERMVTTVNSGYVDARIYLPPSRAGAMKGLLGNYDGNTANDIAKRDGTVLTQPIPFATFYGEYADSWRVPSVAESLFFYGPGESFGGFNVAGFPSAQPALTDPQRADAKAKCLAKGVSDPINLENCINDVGQTASEDFGQSAANAQIPTQALNLTTPKPDLIVTDASVSLSTVCRPYQAILNFKVTVKNQGTAASPARADVGLASALDAHGNGWGNGTGLPALAPGASATVTVPVYYLIADAGHMPGSHLFNIEVNQGRWIDESNFANNSFSPLKVTIPADFCKNRLALIYGNDNSAVAPYKTGLQTKGLVVTPLAASSLGASSTFGDYDLIAIDTFSGNLTLWDGSAEAIRAIAAAQKPIVGIGEGGYAFLGKLTSPIGSPNGWHGSGATGFATTTPVHASLLNPFAVSTTGNRVDVASSGMSYVAIFLPQPAANLELVGRQEGDPNHYTVVYDNKARQALWGFHGLPSNYTNGFSALADLAWYMLP